MTHDAPPARPSPAEEARTLVAAAPAATLATLSDDGGPWASMVVFAALPDGAPVLCVSTLAEHGRNLRRDPRASLVVVGAGPPEDPLDAGRVTLAGVAREPEGAALDAARAAFTAGTRHADRYTGFGDFAFHVLEVQRVRWVGGPGRMATVDPAAYAAARPDPVAPHARRAVDHLNEDHADALLDMARALAGHPDARAARCTGADRLGLDLEVDTPAGVQAARVAYAQPLQDAAGLRAATVELARRARGGGDA